MQFSDAAVPILIAAMFAYIVYRRIRRSVGRQRITRGMFVRVAIFGCVGLVLLALPSSSLVFRLGALAAGGALGLYGLSRTRFEYAEAETFYTPDPYVGLFVVALLVGRLIYRALTSGIGRSGPGLSITFLLLLATIGYYLSLCTGVLLQRQSRSTPPAEAGVDRS